MISHMFLLIFTVAFMGCVLATPLVTQLASRLGAIDRPDQFRRVHKGQVPRMGGLAVAGGVALALAVASYYDSQGVWLGGMSSLTPPAGGASISPASNAMPLPVVLSAGLLILAVGLIDDSIGMSPRLKLAGQALAVVVLYLGGIRIERFEALGVAIDLSVFNVTIPWGDATLTLGPAGFLVTLFWFLGCMNIWNLIDGMDGLASGVALLVTGTLMLVALHLDNIGPALLAAALAGSLAGFLLYNWHPACIFLGDCGSLLIGLLIGVIGIQGSMKSSATVALLLPLLAMGLPISDTAMAIFRRWVRNLPLTLGDRKHIHHLLIGLGLDPRQAAALLYCFSAFLCGSVLLGVALNNEWLALTLAIMGALAFLVILTSRRDELTLLRSDFTARMTRGRQERLAARVAFETIQRIELSESRTRVWEWLRDAASRLGCRRLEVECFPRHPWETGSASAAVNTCSHRPRFHEDAPLDPHRAFERPIDPSNPSNPINQPRRTLSESDASWESPSAQVIELRSPLDEYWVLRMKLAVNAIHPPIAPDIVARFAQRVCAAGARRWLELGSLELESQPAAVASTVREERTVEPVTTPATVSPLTTSSTEGRELLVPPRTALEPMMMGGMVHHLVDSGAARRYN
jgi:UDP-GlcNAc:undecaprenyl-phosphate GlcNAc-1-phosphate transferase